MTTLGDLELWLAKGEQAIMPSVFFKGDVEEAFEVKLTDEQWDKVVTNVEEHLDDVRETVFELVRNEVKFMRKQWVEVDVWEAEYGLVANWLRPDASWANDDRRGCLFETYGLERQVVDLTPINQVWSYLDTGDGGTMVVAGRSVGEPIGFLISEKPWSDPYETVVVS